jgi:hypothetical protein
VVLVPGTVSGMCERVLEEVGSHGRFDLQIYLFLPFLSSSCGAALLTVRSAARTGGRVGRGGAPHHSTRSRLPARGSESSLNA